MKANFAVLKLIPVPLINFFISVNNPPIKTAVDFCDRMFTNVNFELEDVS